MVNTILIIGMGEGLSLGIAEKFGQEGFKIGMISRNANKLLGLQTKLKEQNIVSDFATADVADTNQMIKAIQEIKNKLGSISILQYNAVDYRMKNIMDETVDDLSNGFKISVANAFAATIELLADLKENKGSVLFTGGGSANYPNVDMASISLGKAGIRNLALQLNQALKVADIFVGTVTISGWIRPESETHSPKILADKFWDLNQARNQVEIVY
ncbi:MAG: SDR family NAD(P)-dependent oxidoreductase [Bacteroidetes bacterium]|nr:SDR family NAD(P)-dependent oxidoreductase [Bacteroidota bacterium]